MVAGAAILGATSLLGAGIQANAAQSAASQQAAAQMAALNLANQNLQPIIAQGRALSAGVTPQLQSLLTPGQSAAALSSLPGYQWALGQAQQSAMNAGTTMGLGGNALFGLSQAVTGLNQQYENQYFNQLYNTLTAGLQTQTNAAGTLTGAGSAALTGIGNAQAAGTLGMANAFAGGLGGVGNAALIGALANSGALSNLGISGG